MKTGRLQTLGGVQYGSKSEVQGTALIGADGLYSNPKAPASTVGEALDYLLAGTSRYVEVLESPYLIMLAGDYACLDGGLLYLSEGMALGDKVSIIGTALWSLECNSPMNVLGAVGTHIQALDVGCCISLILTSRGWVATHLLGNVDILLP
jgi:hypothetical protein